MLCPPFNPYATSIPVWNPSNIPWLRGLDTYKPTKNERLSVKYAEISKKYWEDVNMRAHIYRLKKARYAMNNPPLYKWFR
jgi:hypothetical protein